MTDEIGGVRVRVPATSANLGPGFDALGLALDLYDEVEVSLAGSGLSIEVTGEGADTVERGEGHLIARTFRAAYTAIGDHGPDAGPDGRNDAFGRRAVGGRQGEAGGREERRGEPAQDGAPAGLRIRCVNRIPHARGLGSSSAATVAGILAARALHPEGAHFTDQDVLAVATRAEGHPDNVAPCLAGGLTIAWGTDRGPRLTRLDVVPELRPVALVPEQRLATERARGLLPEQVPHADAAANAGRAALLVAALTRRPELMLDATEDRLHQAYRGPAMPESMALVQRLRAKGLAAVISGAGPTVLVLAFHDEVDSIGTEVGTSWHIYPLNVAPHGACVRPIDS